MDSSLMVGWILMVRSGMGLRYRSMRLVGNIRRFLVGIFCEDWMELDWIGLKWMGCDWIGVDRSGWDGIEKTTTRPGTRLRFEMREMKRGFESWSRSKVKVYLSTMDGRGRSWGQANFQPPSKSTIQYKSTILGNRNLESGPRSILHVQIILFKPIHSSTHCSINASIQQSIHPSSTNPSIRLFSTSHPPNKPSTHLLKPYPPNHRSIRQFPLSIHQSTNPFIQQTIRQSTDDSRKKRHPPFCALFPFFTFLRLVYIHSYTFTYITYMQADINLPRPVVCARGFRR